MRVAILVLVFIATVQAAPKVTSTEKNVHHSGGIDGALAAARALEQDVAHLLEEEAEGDEDDPHAKYFSAYKPSQKAENVDLAAMCDIASKMLSEGVPRPEVAFHITKYLLRRGYTPDFRETDAKINKKVAEGTPEHAAIVEDLDHKLTNCLDSVQSKLTLDTGSHHALTRSVYSDSDRISRPKGEQDERKAWHVERGICPFVKEDNRKKNLDRSFYACAAICTEEDKDCFVPYTNKYFAGKDEADNELYHLLPGKCNDKQKCSINKEKNKIWCCKEFPEKKFFKFPPTPFENPGHPVCQNPEAPIC